MDGGMAMAGIARWYVLEIDARREEAIGAELTRRAVDHFLPKEAVSRRCPRTKRPIRYIRPCFPGYLFVELDLARPWRWIVEMPFAFGMLCAEEEGRPTPIQPGSIEKLRQMGIIERCPVVAPVRRYCRNDRVRVTDPESVWQGHEGLYLACKTGRVTLLLDILGRTVRVNVPEALVTPA